MNRLVCFVALAAGASSLASHHAYAVTAPSGTCAQIEIIGARGTLEMPGFGTTLGPIANEVQSNAHATIDEYALPYSASFLPSYQQSESGGVSMLESYLATQSSRCPSQQFVLMGYSQGGQVVNDVLAGGGLSAAITHKVIGVAVFGDPRFNSAESFDATYPGSFTRGLNGILGARPVGSEQSLASVVQSYCNAQDTFCQAGPSLAAHLDYVMTAGNYAYQFLLARVGG